MVGRPLYNLPNATTVESGDKFLIQQGVSSKQVDKDVLLTAENTSWQVGKSVGYVLDDYRGVKDDLYGQAGIVDNGTQNQIGSSQFVDAIHIVTGFKSGGALRRTYEATGAKIVGTFASGATLTSTNDVILDNFGNGWSWDGEYPVGGYIVPPNSTSTVGFVSKNDVYTNVLLSSAFGLSGSNTPDKNSRALREMAKAAMALGSAQVVFQKGTYTIGEQEFAGEYGKLFSYRPFENFKVTGMDSIHLVFEGCEFKWSDGMRFGAFDPVTGLPFTTDATTIKNLNYRADKGFMFDIRDNENVLTTGTVKLHGNTLNTIIGGWWSTLNEWQCIDYGFWNVDNRYFHDLAAKTITDFSLDGYLFGGLDSVNTLSSIENLVSLFSGRNCIAFVGGTNVTMSNVLSGYAGYRNIESLPKSSLDIEAEWSPIKNCVMNKVVLLESRGVTLQCPTYEGVLTEDITFNYTKVYGIKGGQSPLRWESTSARFNYCQFFGAIDKVRGVGGKIVFDTCKFNSKFDNPAKSFGYRDTGTIINNYAEDTGVVYQNCEGYADLEVNHPSAIVAHTCEIDGFTLYVDGYFTDALKPANGAMWLAYLNSAKVKGLRIVNRLITEWTGATTARFGVSVFNAELHDCHISLGQFNVESIVWEVNNNSGTSGRLEKNYDNSSPKSSLTYFYDPAKFATRLLNSYAVANFNTTEIKRLDTGINRGDILWVANHTVGDPVVRRCTIAGTATTRTTIATGSVTAGSNLLTVSSLNNLRVGDYISIGGAYAGTPPRIISINTTTLVLTLSYGASSTVSSIAITFPDPVF